MSQADLLIDRFVEKVSSSPRERLAYHEVPPALRTGDPDAYGDYDWQIQRSDAIDCTVPYEEKLPARLPTAFRSLVTRYAYPAFEIGPLWLFANTGDASQNEMSSAVFGDKVLSAVLLNNGYVQFARPSGGSCDPVCFDTRRKSGVGEYPIVWIDHERILCDDKIRIVGEVADSFAEFIVGYLQQA